MPEYCIYKVEKSINTEGLKKGDIVAIWVTKISDAIKHKELKYFVPNLSRSMDISNNYKSGIVIDNDNLFEVSVAKVLRVNKPKYNVFGDNALEVTVCFPSSKAKVKKTYTRVYYKNQGFWIIKPVKVENISPSEKMTLIKSMINHY